MKIKVTAAVLAGIVCLFSLSTVLSFQVPQLPEGNLVTNPWFRSATDPDDSGLDGWIDAGGTDKYWSSSQKESNPSPNVIISGVCNFEPVYCGTAARLALTPGQSGGVGVPGIDAYLYQIIPANSADRKLTFFAHWVSHRIDPAEVTIYGSSSANGPWTALWTPFYHEQDTNPPPPPGGPADLWEQTGFLDHTLTHGYDFYKLQIHARLPFGDDAVGFKITGIYFTTRSADPPPTSTPTPTAPAPTSHRKVFLPLVEADR